MRSRKLPMIAGLVAGLLTALVLAMTPVAEAAPAGAPSAAAADRGWTTVFKKAGAKVQVCRHARPGAYGLEVRLNARKAKRLVKARSRIEYLDKGTWTRISGHSSDWRRRGIQRFDGFTSGLDYPLRMQVRIRTGRKTAPAYTGWFDPASVKTCR